MDSFRWTVSFVLDVCNGKHGLQPSRSATIDWGMQKRLVIVKLGGESIYKLQG